MNADEKEMEICVRAINPDKMRTDKDEFRLVSFLSKAIWGARWNASLPDPAHAKGAKVAKAPTESWRYRMMGILQEQTEITEMQRHGL